MDYEILVRISKVILLAVFYLIWYRSGKYIKNSLIYSVTVVMVWVIFIQISKAGIEKLSILPLILMLFANWIVTMTYFWILSKIKTTKTGLYLVITILGGMLVVIV